MEPEINHHEKSLPASIPTIPARSSTRGEKITCCDIQEQKSGESA